MNGHFNQTKWTVLFPLNFSSSFLYAFAWFFVISPFSVLTFSLQRKKTLKKKPSKHIEWHFHCLIAFRFSYSTGFYLCVSVSDDLYAYLLSNLSFRLFFFLVFCCSFLFCFFGRSEPSKFIWEILWLAENKASSTSHAICFGMFFSILFVFCFLGAPEQVISFNPWEWIDG